MNCPSCGKEMKEGTLASTRFLVWFPPDQQVRGRDFMLYSSKSSPWEKVGGITLAKQPDPFANLTLNHGWICTHCKKAILDWDESKVKYSHRIY